MAENLDVKHTWARRLIPEIMHAAQQRMAVAGKPGSTYTLTPEIETLHRNKTSCLNGMPSTCGYELQTTCNMSSRFKRIKIRIYH